MQNCNLARSLQFLRLDTHLTSVKCDCNGFAVVCMYVLYVCMYVFLFLSRNSTNQSTKTE